MSRLPHDAAIFSPSVARAAASAAKDWSYVDAWLASRFRGRPAPPRFERNADTLRALLALAALNESADEQRDLLAAVEADALAELEAAATGHDGGERDPPDAATDLASVRRDLLSALAAGLTRDGRASLDAMAAASAAAAGGRLPDPTVEQVRAEEEAYLELLHRKRALDARLRAFEGLPPDAAMARRELEARRDVLRRLTQRRDAVFEGLVERETPRKPRG
ncbi:hypothetical protein GGTG_05220 [Gaeumannomyces tritici R3-111a-1]|uniref:Uncharacterized protein n=1 Tax=Gaeumannomyces tritici (strain R3-111a-1) TaxID=644352 RepID=J3NVA7_GAET3|nr:hypothetical protein GGTG_05220 [Gaeumannomyces tritici R3-111a-1]EJT75283.1 hypothetical protein GGTG_05220 [Gaeumannomyces tritici R3-111a-1]